MLDPAALLAVFAASLLAYCIFAAQRHRRQVEDLRREIDTVEAHNRRLQDERTALTDRLGKATAALEKLRDQHRLLEAEKAELERRRNFLEEAATRLEKARAELEARLASLQAEHASLETRVLDFQGQWDQQLTTVEEEISTLTRQLGEFRKGTQLPIPDRKG